MIPFLFYILFFFVPLIIYPGTFELFEFNKMIFVYVITVLIVGLWVIRMIKYNKFIFRRTIFDIPLLIFLGSQILSTFTSVDFRTSLLGYYSRFNGGLISNLCYCLLYWAFVANIESKYLNRYFKALLISSLIISVYAILEHFGYSFSCLMFTGHFNVACWVQDVQTRVFATLGQPNWLAAWLVAVTPLTWCLALKKKGWIIVSVIFFLTLLYTQSRSGLLAFAAADLIFWSGYIFITKRFNWLFIICNLLFVVLFIINGTSKLVTNTAVNTPPAVGTALETGGTESGTIRQIVWKGAIEIWKHYPILGTGVETFAFSYYGFKPVEHNLVSEWDFLYNKAHNEFLNYAATTGTLGLLSYLFIIGTFCFYTLKNLNAVNLALFSGYIAILITNFFGFSIVPIEVLFFLFPALAIAQEQTTKNIQHSKSYSKLLVFLTLCTMSYVLCSICKYWYADTLYASARKYNTSGNYQAAQEVLIHAVKLSPQEAIFWGELSEVDARLGLIDKAVAESDRAYSLSPKSVVLLRQRIAVFLRLASIDPNYILQAKEMLLVAIKLAPTDAKLEYNLGLVDSAINLDEEAKQAFEKAVQLKSNYTDASNKLK